MSNADFYISLIGDAVDKAVPGTKALAKARAADATEDDRISAVGILMPALALSAAGALLWRSHRVLGGLGGLALGGSLYSFSKGHYYMGVEQLVPTVVGIGESLKHPHSPGWAFVVGSIGAGLVLVGIDVARGKH